jgi:FdrA protein
MAILLNRVKRGFYLDSVALMRVSRAVTAMPGVEDAALMIGSVSNREILDASGLLGPEGREAVANDLILAVRARDAASAEAALAGAEAQLDAPITRGAASAGIAHTRRIDSAMRQLDGANLALISVPGEFAAAEARKALAAGLHVVMFSDNVPVEAEVALKRFAAERGLLMMGPDCGTCIIAGAPIAFANAVPRGSVGLVSASGTGLQEVSTLVARFGGGIAHGIGVGGRDLYEAVGGLTTLAAIDALDRDPAVTTIVLVSKPPAPAVAKRIVERIGASAKPFVVCFMGRGSVELPANARRADTLRHAAELAIGAGALAPSYVTQTAASLPLRNGLLRGLYCGGTLCAEAQDVLLRAGVAIASNVPVPGAARAEHPAGPGHTAIDLGDDAYTRGRPHPMIEPEVRSPVLADALADAAVSTILIDVVLGYGAHADPAAAVIRELGSRPAHGKTVIASVCGTDADPQGYTRTARALEAAGVLVAPSNAHAAELAARCVAGSSPGKR